ncbi:MAG: glycosyltransferase family 2 protein [Opitutaceae bacterium]|nr:glycosyltransferase family 2 protein [Cytophagales bacterium]
MNIQNQNLLFSVIIPTYNRVETLLECLNLLQPFNLELKNISYEIIVSDDSTNDESEKVIKEKFPNVIWVKGPKKGPAANRNNGASFSKGEWLVFTDDDCLPQRNFLSAYLASINLNHESLTFEGAIEPTNEAEFKNSDKYECPVNVTGGNFWSANICIRKSLFDEIGGFDLNYPNAALEDQDIFYRLSERTTIPFVKDSVVLHPYRLIDFENKLKKIPAQARDWAYHAVKHKERFHFQNKFFIFSDSIKFYSKDFVRQISKGRIKIATFNLCYLFIGNFWLGYYLLKNK